MAKAKRTRTAKQLANDERLRNKKATPKTDEEFEPTAVTEARAAGTLPDAVDKTPAETGKTPESVNLPPIGESVPEQPNQVVGPQLQAPTGFSNEQLMAMMLNMQAEMAALRQQNPQAVAAAPETKLDEMVRMSNSAGGNVGAQIGQNGIQGVVTKYSIEKSHYPDPSRRLLEEPTLRRFAMEENYIFTWSVDGVSYEKNGVHYAEPRFTVHLYRKLYDEDGEPTGRMALVARHMMHEDKMFVQMAAMRLGILDKFDSIDELMDEVRYLTIRSWLLDIFRPAKINTFKRKSTTEVINGKAVEVFDTEQLTDKESGIDKSSAIQSQTGVGSVATPKL